MSTNQRTYMLGGHQTDFARNWTKEGLALDDMLRETVPAALADAQVDAADIEVLHVGNLAGELFSGQAQLGGMLASVDPALANLPSSRHEAACASGSIGVLSAMAELEAGRYDVALAVGLELERNVPGQQAADYLGSAAWVGREGVGAEFPWPALFAEMADEFDQRYGLEEEHMRRIGEINFANARLNPNSQTRDWKMESGSFGMDDALNPVIVGRLRKYDCGRITDGAAAAVLASPEYAADYARRRGLDLDQIPYISGWGHGGAPLLLSDKLAASVDEPYLFPHVRQTALEAYGRAGIAGPEEVDAFEVHDCFTLTEYLVLDHLGLTSPGKNWQAVEDGTIELGGIRPVNPSGGLLGTGHPVGATGVRMLVDGSRQVTGRCGEYQVEGARRVATLNIGGSFTTVVSLIIEREAA